MHRCLRAVLMSAALLAVTGLTIPTEVDAAVVKKKTTVVVKRTTVVTPRRAVVGPRVAPRVVGPARVVGPRVGPRVGPARVIGPARVVGPAVVGPRRYFARPLVLRGRSYTVFTGPRSVFWRGRARYLVPLAALGVITVGAVSYRAYGYVPVERPLCEGLTPEGCELRWTEVPTPEGDLIPQCVAYCPQQP